MKIKLTNVFVDDQEKALAFYTNVLGFVTKADFTNGPYRWLTVASQEEPEGTIPLALPHTSRPSLSRIRRQLISSATMCRPTTNA
jgi:catechol 2,3-dioxygenase-like lactoylglutathione lyase family enzyme